LTLEEMEQVLLRGTVGRIGCSAGGRTYVVPITYAYDGRFVVAHSADGLKVRTMRANANVCFEVEEIIDLAHWVCVMAQGTYEELRGEEEQHAESLLRARFGSVATSETALRHPRFNGIAQPVSRTTLFRLRLTEKTGRFER
jgi:uncharacterized protein